MRNMHRLICLLVFCSQIVAAETTQWRGAKLTDLIGELNERGLQIIYSNALVSGDLVIEEEPDLSNPITGLKSALRPLGLTLVAGPEESWLVVRPEPSAINEIENANVEPDELPLVEIVVTSSLHRLANLRSNSQTSVDREFMIRTPSAAEEAVRVIARLPGTANGGLSTRSHVRGGEVNEVLFLIDGLRLYEPFHLKDFQSVATIINSSAIDGLDFYSGAYPARFGDRMSGVISLGLREPEKDVETELALSFFNTSLLSMGRFGDAGQGDWLLAARRGNLDLIADIINPDIGNPDYQDYILHAGWDFGPRARISANFLMSNDKLILADVDRGENVAANYTNQVAWLKWQANWSSRLSSETLVSLSDISDERRGTLLLPGIVSGSLDENRQFQSASFQQDWTYASSSSWILEIGVDASHLDANYRFDSTKRVTPPFDEILDNEALLLRSSDLQPEGTQYGVHAQLRWQFAPGLVADFGFRRDRQSYTSAKEDTQSSPRASLLYQFDEKTEMRLGWGQYSQAQEINELQVSDGVEDFFPAQRAEHLVANLTHVFDSGTSIEVSLYRKSFRAVRPRFENAFNSLTLLPEIQFDRVEVDANTALAKGAEILLTHGDGEDELFWWLGYTWSEIQDEFSGEKIARAWDQTHSLKAGMSWRWASWDLSVAGEMHSGWPSTELVAETVSDPDGTQRLELSTTAPQSLNFSTFHRLDIRISREIALSRGDLTVFAEVTNLYDRKNTCCIEYSIQNNPGGAPVLFAQERRWLPLVPSLGVVWRF